MRKRLGAAALFAACALAVLFQPRARVQAQPETPPDVRTILIRCGVTDTAGKTWTGALEPAGAGSEVVALRAYHFQPPDRVDGNKFEFATRPWVTAFQQVDLSPGRPGPRAVFPNGVYATVKGDRFKLTMDGASYPLAIADQELAGGNIEVQVALTPLELSAHGSGEADYPSVAAGPNGRAAAAWQEFLGEKDRLVTREFDGRSWLPAEPHEASQTRDVFRTAVAYDGAGTLHLVWSAQVDGNWDLYERRKTAEGWQPIERLTDAAGPDFHHKLIADSKGDLWLAWQAFRGGQSDLFARRYSGGSWQPELKVSESPANDWEPSLAVSATGRIWIAWDSYDRGNYDIFARSFDGQTAGPVRAVTRSPRFEAHASIACDPEGRPWVAYDEAEVNWGKDYGYLWKERGNPLYQSRNIRIVRLDADKIVEPAQPLSAAFPLGLPEFLQYPQISFTADGRLRVAALQLTHADRVIEVWGARGVWEQVAFTLGADGWSRERVLPSSTGAHDIRAAIAGDWIVWASDGRNFQNGNPQKQTVQVARLEPGERGSDKARERESDKARERESDKARERESDKARERESDKARERESDKARERQGDKGTTRQGDVKAFTEPVELAFPTHPEEAANIANVRQYRIRAGGKEYRVFRGDLHRHTSLSGDGVGDGSLWDFYRYMLDAADMDLSTVTDHQGGGTAYNWWKAQKSTDLYHLPGRMTSIYAYERSVLYPNGHRNIVFPKRGAPILPISPAEQQGRERSADKVLPYLRKYGAIAFRHTTATNQGTDWQDHNNELEPMVEVYQGHRVVYEHEGGPKGATAEKMYLQRSGYRPAGFLWNALARGYRMGFQASSDHCSTHVSYACVLSQSGTREALIDAMRRRHVYGATDNIVMDFRVRANGEEYLQGDEIGARGRYTLSVNIIGTGSIERVDVIRNEKYVHALGPAGKSRVSFTWVDPKPDAGENRYYIRMMQENGHIAWSSPVWIAAR